MVQSMLRKKDCWDNAVCESFFSTLKLKLGLQYARSSRLETERAVFEWMEEMTTREAIQQYKLETERAVFEWMEVFYNRQRLHSSLGFQSPVEFEASQAA